MIGAFWNVRCLNKEGRIQCLADFVKDNKLGFVGFQEAKRKILMILFCHTLTRISLGRYSLLRELWVLFW
jgi:hypothetical protein